jgi:hypothetical protein
MGHISRFYFGFCTALVIPLSSRSLISQDAPTVVKYGTLPGIFTNTAQGDTTTYSQTGWNGM